MRLNGRNVKTTKTHIWNSKPDNPFCFFFSVDIRSDIGPGKKSMKAFPKEAFRGHRSCRPEPATTQIRQSRFVRNAWTAQIALLSREAEAPE